MLQNRRRFVALSQRLLAAGTVLAVAAPAAAVVTLDIEQPAPLAPSTTPADRSAGAALVASEPVEPTVTTVEVEGVEEDGLQALTQNRRLQRNAESDLAALSAPQPVEGYATVGVTWKPGVELHEDEISVSVRTLQDGAWSAWQEVEYHDEHAPTPGSLEARRARPGTEPIVVGAVDEVQVKAVTEDGEAPADLELAVVDPGITVNPQVEAPEIDTAALEADAAGAAPAAALMSATPGTTDPAPSPSPTPGTPPTDPGTEPVDPGTDPADGVLIGTPAWVTPKPKIFSRAQWGADERMRDKPSLSYYEVHAGFVHHTVNANNYTRAQVPSLIRGIYAYHTQAKGWSDIGYNFIVDKFGRIWEGRYGGVDRPVVGAHTLGYNEYSFAMSALGNFDSAKPSSAMLDSYGRLFAWKLSLHGVNAGSTSQRVGSKSFPAINGHRDAGSTACPGRYLYAKMSTIRSLATQYQKPFADRTRSTNLAGSPWPDLVVRDSVTKKAYILRTGGQAGFQSGRRVLSGWNQMDLITPVRDVTGDGVPDLMARRKDNGVTSVYPGTAQGAFADPILNTRRFRNADQLSGSMDLTGDGKNDVVARIKDTGKLYVYPGNGRGGFKHRKLLSDEWGKYELTAGAADLTGDGDPDLIARDGARLYVVPGVDRRIGDPLMLPGKWGPFDLITGMGDVTGDGNADIVVRRRKNKMTFVYPGDGAGSVDRRFGPYANFKHLSWFGVVGGLAGNPANDLVGRDGKGRIVVFPHNGAKNVEAVVDTGATFGGVNLVLNVGDWNGDGNGDVMTRNKHGVMQLRAGDGKGRLADPVVAGKGWGRVKLIAAVGDITGDGHPDLLGQPKGMAMRIYPGNGSTGFLTSYVAHSAISSTGQTGLGLWNGDGSPDSLVRRADGALLLYPGNGPGGLTNPVKIGSGAQRYDWLQAVGDADGDGRPDLVGRDKASGALWLLPGRSSGFGPRRLLREGLANFDLSS